MHNSISGTEAADRLAIRQLIEAYAHCADRRDAKGQMRLFTPDTHFIIFMDAKSSQPAMDLRCREDLAPVFADFNNMRRRLTSWDRARLCWTKIKRREKHTVSPIMFLHRKKNDQSL